MSLAHDKRVSNGGPIRYQPLEHSDSFRLLYLRPSSDDSSIVRCFIFNASRSWWAGKYTALSYAWGALPHTQRILLNGKDFWIRQNLYDFLVTWRHPERAMTLWVDAICIDQNTVEELNHQVKIMTDIYRNAERVYCWLGLAANDSDWLFDILGQHNGSENCRHYGQHSDFSKLSVRERLFDELETLNRPGGSTELTPGSQRLLQAFAYLANRSYFGRLWIVQEICLATDFFFLCGLKRVKGSIVADFSFSLVNSWLPTRYPSETLFESLEPNANMSRIFRLFHLHQGHFVTIENAISELGPLQCSKLHDKVFAVTGLLSKDDQAACSSLIDYNMSTTALLVATMQTLRPADSVWFLEILLENLCINPRLLYFLTPTLNVDFCIGTISEISLPKARWKHVTDHSKFGISTFSIPNKYFITEISEQPVSTDRLGYLKRAISQELLIRRGESGLSLVGIAMPSSLVGHPRGFDLLRTYLRILKAIFKNAFPQDAHGKTSKWSLHCKMLLAIQLVVCNKLWELGDITYLPGSHPSSFWSDNAKGYGELLRQFGWDPDSHQIAEIIFNA